MPVPCPSRRTFLTGSAGTIGLSAFTVALSGSANAATQALLPTVTSSDLITDFSFSTSPEWHLARRACMAPNGDIVAEIQAKGIPAWLDEQIAYGSIDDSEYERERELYFPFYGMDTRTLEGKPFGYTEVYSGYLPRATLHEHWRSKRQLKASLTDFFADQLSFSVLKVTRSGASASVNAIRDNVLGKYSDMLKAMEYSLGMNAFLDNIGNTKNVPNQNLAREMLELHSLGAGSYTQDDVINATTVMTGMVQTSGFRMTFHPDSHQNGPVRIGSWTDANVGGSVAACEATLNSLLRYLARHPNTAKRLATRLATRYVSDTPPKALVDRLAAIYLANDTAIGPVVKALFTSPEFMASVGQKVRRPQNVAAAALAAGHRQVNHDGMVPYLTARGNSFAQVARLIENAGHAPYSRTFPDGFPLENRQWVTGTSLLSLINFEQLAFFRSNEMTTPDWYAICDIKPTDRYSASVPKAIKALSGYEGTASSLWRPISAAWSGDVGTIPSIYGFGPVNRFVFVPAAVFASPMFLIS